MPINKNALTRYKYLDKFLSDKHHFYTMSELAEMCNEKLAEIDQREVTIRGRKKIIY